MDAGVPRTGEPGGSDPAPIRVGTNATGYRERRNIIDLPFRHTTVRRSYGVLTPLDHVYYRLRGRTHPLLHFAHQDFGLNGVDLHHFFFSVSFGPTPWVVSFSSWIPRWGKQARRGIRRLAGPSCRRMIAISDWAWHQQQHGLRFSPDALDAMRPKVTVIHPQQPTLIDSYDEKALDADVLELTVIGAQFFVKGGGPLLRVVDRLLDEGLPLRLNVVSRLEYGDRTSRSTIDDQREAQRVIAKHPERIVHHETLPNADVLDLLRRSHVGVLLTYGDTYGYSILEAQAAGCATLTTDVAVLPEINSAATGWVVATPKSEYGHIDFRGAGGHDGVGRIVEDGTERALRAMLADPAAVRARGEAALARVRSEHDPQDVADRLEAVYREALGR